MIPLNFNTPNQEFRNTVDNKNYFYKQTLPNDGVLFVNKETQQEELVPNDELQKINTNQTNPTLVPIMKTHTNMKVKSMHDEINDIVSGGSSVSDEDIISHLEDDIATSIQSIVEDVTLINKLDGDSSNQDTSDGAMILDEISGKDSESDNNDQHDNGTKEPVKTEDVEKEEKSDEEKPEEEKSEKESSVNPFLSTNKPIGVVAVSKRWNEIRRSIKTRDQVAFETQQEAHKHSALQTSAKDIGYSPDKRTTDDSGHSKVNNIPVSSPPKEKDSVIGLTEFPKGEKRDDSVGLDTGKGYNLPFKEMDENQVANREKFDNEQRMYIDRMTIRQLRSLITGDKSTKEIDAIEKGKGIQQEREPVKPEDHPLYEEKKAILQEIGLVAFADETPESGNDKKKVQEGPIQHKVLKTAPKIPEYTEPAVIEPATGKLKEAITKLSQTATSLAEAKDRLAAEAEPLVKQLAEVQAKHNPDIKKYTELLNSYIEMVYKQTETTVDKLAHYGNEIWARVTRMKEIKPQVTVPQVLAELDKTNELAAKIVREIVSLLESQQGGSIAERYLYEFPASKEHEKRMKPEASLVVIASAESIIQKLALILYDLATLNNELSTI